MVQFAELYPKLDSLHTALQRLKEAHGEESLLIRTQEELDAINDILEGILELETFLIDVNKRLEQGLEDVESQDQVLKRKYPSETLEGLKQKVNLLIEQSQKLSQILEGEEKEEYKEMKRL